MPSGCLLSRDANSVVAGDFDDGGPGVIMHDLDYTNRRQPHFYFFYENNQDDHPWKYTVLQPGAQIFISVCPTFAGRIVRGNPAYNLNSSIQHNLGTWVEISWEAPPSTRSWGDVSLLEGCDGAALLASTDGSGVITGFSINILTGAPYAALASKSDGSVVLAKTVGDEANFEATQYELGLLDPTTQAFIVQSYKPVIVTTNGRWDLTVYPGTY
ncbi:hypothetical protein B0H67DRAFT_480548 [Lasiosphaeris hirsuta]|uniref:Uncharacterized protein n=1 Tax=Lasiosphaeris hirsuta TaxID=260670 RepID=A0AA40AZW4_9PEZI|nr:hypothetical protein B0H67DRAFT_480548 [Lasiosphaeris hirsuta]